MPSSNSTVRSCYRSRNESRHHARQGQPGWGGGVPLRRADDQSVSGEFHTLLEVSRRRRVSHQQEQDRKDEQSFHPAIIAEKWCRGSGRHQGSAANCRRTVSDQCLAEILWIIAAGFLITINGHQLALPHSGAFRCLCAAAAQVPQAQGQCRIAQPHWRLLD